MNPKYAGNSRLRDLYKLDESISNEMLGTNKQRRKKLFKLRRDVRSEIRKEEKAMDKKLEARARMLEEYRKWKAAKEATNEE